MSDERYDLVFKGQLAKSFELTTAVKNLAQLFKIDPLKVKAMFDGRTTVLKRNLDMETATKYRVAIKKAGALVELEAVKEAAEPKPRAQKESQSEGKAVFGAREPSSDLSPAVAEQAVKVDTSNTQIEKTGLTTSAGVFSDPRPEPVEIAIPDFDIAPVGEDLLKPSEKPPAEKVEIDTSSLSIKEAEGNLLEDDEYEEIVPLPFDASAFDLAPVGADVLKPEERNVVAEVEVDISSLSVDDSGGNLAPPKPAAPPPPDTSGLKLAD